MPNTDERVVALEMIAADLDRLVRQADAHRLALLAYLLDMAANEAREELRTKSFAGRPTVTTLRPGR